MENRIPNFQHTANLKADLDEGKSVFAAEMLCEGYPGMVIFAGLNRDKQSGQYLLNLEWMSYGLDYSGENWQQSYQYGADSLAPLLAYLYAEFGIEVTDIPFRTPRAELPNPLDSALRPGFEASWDRFLADFQGGKFRAPGLTVLHSDEGVVFTKPGE